ncbi:MAG: ABC transporter permease, partial [Methylobacteriaceae bacterium]|nr:ABC transporter permease [Methylobacteriaceae bacterium]
MATELAGLPASAARPPVPGPWARFLDSDLLASFRRSPIVMISAGVTALIILSALFAPLISPQNPFDPRQLDLLNSHIPPIWSAEGQSPFTLGTDDQGRDIFSAVLFGLRISLWVGVLGTLFSAALGVLLGLVAGYVGGVVDSLIMRVADVQLTFPAILIALLIDGTVRALFGEQRNED